MFLKCVLMVVVFLTQIDPYEEGRVFCRCTEFHSKTTYMCMSVMFYNVPSIELIIQMRIINANYCDVQMWNSIIRNHYVFPHSR